MSDERWVEVSKSQFTHEAEGLNYLRSKLPMHSPYRAWTNFEFRDSRGRWHEVDALVLTQSRLHLIELKYYSGRLRGNDHTWLRDGHRAEESPLLLARRKAQYFSSKLKDEFYAWAKENKTNVPPAREVIPFIQESVFLHHPNLVCELSESSSINLFGLDETEKTSNLPGISDLLLEEPYANNAIGGNKEQILAALMKRIGLVPRREREAGSWIIEEGALDQGNGWQDWRGYHKVAKDDLVRIRFLVTSPNAPQSEQNTQHKIAENEHRVLRQLNHDGILKTRDLVESDLGVGLVYDFSDTTQRLDLWLAGQTKGTSLDQQLTLVHQLGEALDYAHGHRVVHRGLSPKAVWIDESPEGPKAKIGDWQTAGRTQAETAHDGVTSLALKEVDSPEQAWLTEAFAAPEGRWAPNADRIRLDVFGLGALTYFLLTGKSPASSAIGLKERLRLEGGLDLSVDLPQVPSAIRAAVLAATNPSPTDRTATVQKFLQELDAFEATSTTVPEETVDPLDAKPGAVLGGGRFEVVRRLGRGSTALGLLVRDAEADGAERVLKVALDERAAKRLEGEAEVLAKLKGNRLVSMAKETQPLDVDGRTALLLESAGGETLSDTLRGRRLTIDYLERYGTDLLEALIQLDAAGVDHRDIKPSNLGVKDQRNGKHLVLFDFSLSRASATSLEAGTPPYLDPFLGALGKRQHFDSAAERYSAAVVLYEMATGKTPFYGDPYADPAAVKDEVHLDPADFDEAIRAALVPFFRKALAREASARHDTAAQMLEIWRAAFTQTVTTASDDAERLASAATLTTPLADAGFSARALSAVEHLSVTTVGDLLAVDPVRLNALSGSADATRREVKSRASAWRKKFGAKAKQQAQAGKLPSVRAIAETLVAECGSRRGSNGYELARLIFGFAGNADALGTQGALGATLAKPIGTARVGQLLDKMQEAWAESEAAIDLLRSLENQLADRLDALGGVATVDELTDAILERTTPEGDRTERRVAEGLLRVVAVDRARALKRAEDDSNQTEQRRRNSRIALIARSTTLLDLAEALGAQADRLLSEASGASPLVPADRVSSRLTAAVSEFTGTLEASPAQLAALTDRSRLARLAAGTSQHAAATGSAELHRHDLSQKQALAIILRGLVGTQRLTRHEIQTRFKVRFPALPLVPSDSRLDALIGDANLDLRFDHALEAYTSLTVESGTTGFPTQTLTRTQADSAPVASAGAIEQRLRDSAERRSFLALGVRASLAGSLVRILEGRFNARTVDVTGLLIDSMQDLAESKQVPPWDSLVKADAQPKDSRAGRGLAVVVERALPAVEAAIQSGADDGGTRRPVLLTEASPLARYGHADVLKRLSDLSVSRGQAVWLVLPQMDRNQGALLDGVPMVTSPNQFLKLDREWVENLVPTLTEPEGVTS
ncbi:BREX system serine/threonine kinase PglW [Sinomonas sp. B1-1]|uniref:BREX system serine/threonine kinase PglW n=1 Tax=Sinomonas sp. B1-1 TaxID=3141454 RepID=UPI003D298FF5